MSTYAVLLALCVLGPVVFSFNSRVRFFGQWGMVAISSMVVSIPFLIWDMIAANRGDWGFNSNHVGQMKIIGLPLEEVLFFTIIPFCCLFIWWILNKGNQVQIQKKPKTTILEIVVFVTFIIGAWVFRDKYYTATIMGWGALTVLVVEIMDKSLWEYRLYWKWLALTFVPFVIVNGVLTYLPVVWYSDQAILGVRLISIPIEDFIYSWSLLTLNLVVYRKISSCILSKN